VALLAARAPKLGHALAAARKAGHAFVVLDGTLIPIDRVAADRPFYSSTSGGPTSSAIRSMRLCAAAGSVVSATAG
jgi:hypothetical protein